MFIEINGALFSESCTFIVINNRPFNVLFGDRIVEIAVCDIVIQAIQTIETMIEIGWCCSKMASLLQGPNRQQ